MLLLAQDKQDRLARQNIIDVYVNLKASADKRDGLEHMFLYLPALDLVIADTGTSEAAVYCEAYLHAADGTKGALDAFLAPPQYRSLLRAEDGALFVATTLPIGRLAGISGTIVLQYAPEAAFAPLSPFLERYGGAAVVADGEGRLLYAAGTDEGLLSLAFGLSPESLSAGSAPEAPRDVTALRADSGALGFSVVSFVRAEVLLNRALLLRKLLLISAAACLLAGVAMAYGFSVRRYRPLQRITRLISKEGGVADEYGHIEQILLTITSEKAALERRFDAHRQEMREADLRRLLTGTADMESAERILRDAHPALDTESMYVALVAGIPENLLPQTREALQRWLDGRCAALALPFQGMLAVVLCADSIAAARNLMQNLYGHLRGTGKSLCVGISRRAAAPEALPLACRDALEALETLMLLQGEGVADAGSASSSPTWEMSATLYDHIRLQKAMQSGSLEEMTRVFDRIVAESFPEQGIPFPLLRCRMFSLINTMLLALEALETPEERRELSGSMERLLGCATVGALTAESRALFAQLHAQLSPGLNGRFAEKGRLVLAYIQAEYADPNLSVASIAEHFGMNPSYISRAFKHFTGNGLLETIHAVRIAAAKEMLTKTDWVLRVIGEQTGYLTEQAFFRAFKRQEGMTPSQYRREHTGAGEGSEFA